MPSVTIYVITNLFITNNYLLEMIRIIFFSIFSEFIYKVALKFRFLKALQKKYFQSDITFKTYVNMPPIMLQFYDIYILVWEVLL